MYSELLEHSQQVFVNPCGENEVCPPSFSESDDSWIISGFWGHYIGVGTRYYRINLPLAVSNSKKKSGVAIAHAGLSKSFLYLGNDDGDKGTLPVMSFSSSTDGSTEGSSTTSVKRWVVWSKKQEKHREKLADIPIHKHQKLTMSIHNGPLPSKIPSSWVAWEPERLLKPLFPSILDPEDSVVTDS